MYDVLPHILWTKKFLGDQGLQLRETIIYQDNTSSILLEKNGRHSSSRRTKHMDKVNFNSALSNQGKAISIQHCPTEEMLADFFTKPLQGSPFFLNCRLPSLDMVHLLLRRRTTGVGCAIMIPTRKLRIPTRNPTRNLWFLNPGWHQMPLVMPIWSHQVMAVANGPTTKPKHINKCRPTVMAR